MINRTILFCKQWSQAGPRNCYGHPATFPAGFKSKDMWLYDFHSSRAGFVSIDYPFHDYIIWPTTTFPHHVSSLKLEVNSRHMLVLRDVRAITPDCRPTSRHLCKVATHCQPISTAQSSRVQSRWTRRARQTQIGTNLKFLSWRRKRFQGRLADHPKSSGLWILHML